MATSETKQGRQARKAFNKNSAAVRVRKVHRGSNRGGRASTAMADVGYVGRTGITQVLSRSSAASPALIIGGMLRDALNPDLAPRPVKTLADMTPEQQAEMRRLYERPAKKSG